MLHLLVGYAGRAALASLLAVSPLAAAQSCPAPGQTLFPGLTGSELREAIAAAYRPAAVLSYTAAREAMYLDVDNNGGQVVSRYTGRVFAISPTSPTPRQDAAAQGLNAEHTYPQSRGAEPGTLGHSDLHHLFPEWESANSSRNNDPFDEIDDPVVDRWYGPPGSTTAPPAPAERDLYSERDGAHPTAPYTGRWEPREDHKGDAARAVFYFYTVYQAHADAADPAFFRAQQTALRAWLTADPVDVREHTRTCRVARYQTLASGAAAVNPFVIDPTLAERAYFGQPEVQFAFATATVTEGTPFVDVPVSLVGQPSGPVTVAVSLAGGTATSGTDFEWTDTSALTFAPGTAQQTLRLVLTDDGDAEPPETVYLAVTVVSGGATVGVPAVVTLTLRDDDGAGGARLWVNEFHYDNAGADTGEFIELAMDRALDPARVTLTLYNGNGGEPYGAHSGADFTPGDTVGGVTLYSLSFPANGLQNGPDGIALSVGGAVVQFLSYEGSFTATSGPAADLTSDDIGVAQTGTTAVGSALALGGTGREAADFGWSSYGTASPGALNAGQTVLDATVSAGSEATASGLRLAAVPNPGARTVRVGLGTPAMRLDVTLVDVLGRRVAVLHRGPAAAGTTVLALPRGLAPGVYTVAVTTDGWTDALRVSVVR